MYSHPELVFKYLNHTRRASSGKGHGVHSPFVFDFITDVLNDNRSFYPFAAIEGLRSGMQQDRRTIRVDDYGQTQPVSTERMIADIARRSLSKRKFGQLLFRTVNHYRPRQILELGTSLGISGAYLAAADPTSRLTTLEGSAAIAAIAGENFKTLGLDNIHQVVGHFEDTLSGVIESSPPPGLVFIDGHHQKTPVLQYFRQLLASRPPEAVFIFHDIHWSREMEEAWKIICADPAVMLSVDIFYAGFVFFRDTFRIKQHFNIRY